MKLAAFDLEIAAVVAGNDDDWAHQPDLGISCAAIAGSPGLGEKFFSAPGRLSRESARQLVHELLGLMRQGVRIVTWNGCGFDFRILAEESGMQDECAFLALNHSDLMLIVTFTKGWYLGLDKALMGAGLKGKLKEVALKDGRKLSGMEGAMAPRLWAQGEHEAVLAYLRDDVVQLLGLAEHVNAVRRISWISSTNRRQQVTVLRLLTVAECFGLPQPDTSWMKDPPERLQFVAWIFGEDRQLPTPAEALAAYPSERFLGRG